jgi:hypothetical protein
LGRAIDRSGNAVKGTASRWTFATRTLLKELNISQAILKSLLNTIFRRLKIEDRVALPMLAEERSKLND